MRTAEKKMNQKVVLDKERMAKKTAAVTKKVGKKLAAINKLRAGLARIKAEKGSKAAVKARDEEMEAVVQLAQEHSLAELKKATHVLMGKAKQERQQAKRMEDDSDLLEKQAKQYDEAVRVRNHMPMAARQPQASLIATPQSVGANTQTQQLASQFMDPVTEEATKAAVEANNKDLKQSQQELAALQARLESLQAVQASGNAVQREAVSQQPSTATAAQEALVELTPSQIPTMPARSAVLAPAAAGLPTLTEAQIHAHPRMSQQLMSRNLQQIQMRHLTEALPPIPALSDQPTESATRPLA